MFVRSTHGFCWGWVCNFFKTNLFFTIVICHSGHKIFDPYRFRSSNNKMLKKFQNLFPENADHIAEVRIYKGKRKKKERKITSSRPMKRSIKKESVFFFFFVAFLVEIVLFFFFFLFSWTLSWSKSCFLVFFNKFPPKVNYFLIPMTWHPECIVSKWLR